GASLRRSRKRHVGQLYSVAQTSKDNTGGGEGIEVLTNQPYEGGPGERGQFTHKIYHLQSKVPGFVRLFAPEGSLVFHEKAWNAYPYCRTGEKGRSSGDRGMDDFFIKIETWHHPDMGTQDNVIYSLEGGAWMWARGLAHSSPSPSQDYKPEEDPALFKSVKTGRGPLGPDWQRELASRPPHMCAYKLVTVKFRWWGLQGRVESFIHKQEKRLFTNFHRQLFCWLDRWVDLSMEEIRRLEEETQRELDQVTVG
uniref:Phosphatidylinositol transfer protein N-terminal domain-containing protein n=1 Tax=Ornithorhynchus anatinus TaxID=9258 RepID=A0A6I8NEG3_ORNAN